MKVARLHGTRDIRLSDEPVPVAGAGAALVRVTAVGICGSDLHWYEDAGIGDATLGRPLVIGHEFAGVVEGGRHDGELVAVDPAIPCGHCESCLAGHRNLCLLMRFAGHSDTDGGLREYVAWPEHLLHPLPPGLSAADGAMLEPLGVAIHAWDLGHVRIASSVAVIGCGPIGLCLVQLARAAGCTTVIAADPIEHRRVAALASGADVVVDPSAPLPGGGSGSPAAVMAALLADAHDGRGVDVAFEVAGTDSAVALAIESARPGARVVLAGIPGDDHTGFGAASARRRGLSLVMVRRMKETVYPRGIRLVGRGLVDLRALVTHRFALTDAGRAFEVAQARTGLKVLITDGGDD